MTMPSMPQPVSDDQDSSAAKEVILGVDTHNDVHVAAVIIALGGVCCIGGGQDPGRLG
jgi:hypothetical protein